MYHHFVDELEPGVLLGKKMHVPGFLVEAEGEFLETEIGDIRGHVILDRGDLFVCFPVFGYLLPHVVWDVITRSGELHERGRHVADVLDFAKINENVHVVKKSLPPAVAICQSSSQSVGQGPLACGRIGSAV